MPTLPSLMSHDIAQLEELFAHHKADPQVLKELGDELRYRWAPQALALLVQIQDILKSAQAATGVAADATPRAGEVQTLH